VAAFSSCPNGPGQHSHTVVASIGAEDTRTAVGGYHVHNTAKYCACHPEATECKAKARSKEEGK